MAQNGTTPKESGKGVRGFDMEGEEEKVVTTQKTPHTSFQDCGEREKKEKEKKHLQNSEEPPPPPPGDSK